MIRPKSNCSNLFFKLLGQMNIVQWRGFIPTQFCFYLLCSVIAFWPVAFAQGQPPANQVGPGAVRINLRGDTPLSTLVEYVSQRLKIRIIHDDSLANKKINLQAPEEIPVESLFDLLQSALQINGMTISKTDNPAWYRISPMEKMPQVSTPSNSTLDTLQFGPAVPVTQVFQLKRGDPVQVKSLIQPFLSSTSANSIAVNANRTLIVTDVASNLRRIQRLIDLLDAEQLTSSIRFVKIEHVAPKELADRLQEILAARTRADGSATSGSIQEQSSQANSKSTGTFGIEIAVDPRMNQLILIGLPSQIDATMDLIKKLDVPLATVSQTYRPQFLSPKQVDDLLQPWVESMAPKPPFESRVESATLIVTTTIALQQQIGRLIAQFDNRETSAKQSPIRFYKIKNVPVQDILETLNSLQGGYGLNPYQSGRSQGNPQRSRATNDRSASGQSNSSMSGALGNQAGFGSPSTAPGVRSGGMNQSNTLGAQTGFPNANNSAIFNPNGNPLGGANSNLGYGAWSQQGGPYSGFAYGASPYGPGSLYPVERGIVSPLGNAQVTADLGSNTLIIIAEPEAQQAYQQLIEFLDKRRPQVMIEARIIIIDTTDDYTLGVEISGGDRTGAQKLFAFSSYGLSTVTPATGALAITPGQGFNATLVDPDTADVVVRALSTHKRARVLSAPKILVDDNAEGTLESVNEVPYTSVNASQTVATTSFAGFAKAGTSINVTPTISEGKHVNLDYVVTLNSFTGAGSTGVPPPRQTNEIKSRVTVPDGYTIVVGGLTQKNLSTTVNGIPYLERIPVLKQLSSMTTNSNRDNTLFVFLRPIILEEDRFRDLKFLTKRAAMVVDDGHNFPASSPLLMSK